MRILGWIVLAAFLGDGLLSAASDFMPSLLPASNVVTGVAMLLAMVSLVLAIIGRPRPRVAFFLFPAFYVVTVAIGVAVGFQLMQQMGVAQMQQVEITPTLMMEKLPWFRPVLYFMHFMHLVIACYTLFVFAREPQPENLTSTAG